MFSSTTCVDLAVHKTLYVKCLLNRHVVKSGCVLCVLKVFCFCKIVYVQDLDVNIEISTWEDAGFQSHAANAENL